LEKEIEKTDKDGKTISNEIIKKWTGQMIEAICYLHNNDKQRIIHRDIKPA
jgi:serine/threonine protein kinase